MLSRKRLGYLMSVWCASAALAPAGASGAEALPVPFAERFDRPDLNAAWKVHASQGATIGIRDEALVLTARENTYAHIERPL
ncbi:MAG: hypothetical protein ACPMAQ_08355, partial [Phycisphaerae bacterium]